MSVATGTAIALGVAGASAATSIYGAHAASSASQHAADIQSQAANEALAWEKQKYATQTRQFDPYRRASELSLARLQSLAGQPIVSGGYGRGYSAPVATGGRPSEKPMSLGGAIGESPAASSAGQTVMMQSPTGERQAVPIALVSHYEQQGAQRV